MTLSDAGSERAVLSGICQNGLDAYIDVSDIITANSFTLEHNQLIYFCLEKILTESKNIDIAAIVTTAHREGIYDKLFANKKNVSIINSLFNFIVKSEAVRQYAKRLAKLELARIARDKIKAAYNELGNIDGSESIDTILSIPENAIFDLVYEANRSEGENYKSISSGGRELLQHLIDYPVDIAGIPTPWKVYNTVIGGGFRKGGVNLIGAHSKVGKTTLGKEIALHCAIELKIPVLMLDTEMSHVDQYYRSLASLSEIDITDIETGNFALQQFQIDKIFQAHDKLEQVNFHYKSIAGKPFEEVLSIIRRWIIKEVGYDDNSKVNNCLIIYDYFKLMNEDQLKIMQEYQAIGFQISRLSDFCKEYDFACVAFVQLNRQGDISQSDRLRWLCHSYSTFKKKPPEEIATDGVENGNRRMDIDCTRHGPGLEGDHIDMYLNGKHAMAKEIGLNSLKDLRSQSKQTGFLVEDKDELTPIGQDDTTAF